MVKQNVLSLQDVRKRYNDVECFFTYFTGDNFSFDFFGTNADGHEVRISIGGNPAWIKYISFGPNDGLNIGDAIERHIRYLSITYNKGKVLYEQFFDINQKDTNERQ